MHEGWGNGLDDRCRHVSRNRENIVGRPAIMKVLTGSELNGADQDVAEWAGLDMPEEKWDEYVDLVGGVNLLSEFFESIENGTFEIAEMDDDLGPGMNDTYWVVTTSNVEALRSEVRQRLMEELGL